MSKQQESRLLEEQNFWQERKECFVKIKLWEEDRK